MAQVLMTVDTDDIADYLKGNTITRIDPADDEVDGFLGDVLDAFINSVIVTVDGEEARPVLRLVE